MCMFPKHFVAYRVCYSSLYSFPPISDRSVLIMLHCISITNVKVLKRRMNCFMHLSFPCSPEASSCTTPERPRQADSRSSRVYYSEGAARYTRHERVRRMYSRMNRPMTNPCTLLLIVALASSGACTMEQSEPRNLWLRSKHVNPQSLTDARNCTPFPYKASEHSRPAQQRAASGETQQLLVILADGAMNRSNINSIGKMVEVAAYIPDRALLVLGDGDDVQALESAPIVDAVKLFDSSLKLSPDTLNLMHLMNQTKVENSSSSALQQTLSANGFDVNVVYDHNANSTSRSTIIQLGVSLPPRFTNHNNEEAKQSSATALSAIRHALQCEHKSTSCEAAYIVTAETIQVQVPAEYVNAAVHTLARLPIVHFIEPNMAASVQNLATAAVVQSSNRNWHVMWNNGIYGSGELIACGDTGVDVSHCLFDDDGDASTPSWAAIGPSHRKIQAYKTLRGTSDSNGHGTHVAGTLLGSTPPWDQVEEPGVASGARLVFTDLSDQPDGTLRPPGDLNNEYLRKSREEGARITSDSWAFSSLEYTRSSRDVDCFMWENQDAISVFAAGNYGQEGYTSVHAPATAKNALAVGATLSPNSRDDQVKYSSRVFEIANTNLAFQPVIGVLQSQSSPSASSQHTEKDITVVLADPNDGCSKQASQSSSSSNTFLLVTQPYGCDAETIAQNAHEAGAAGVLIVNSGNACGYEDIKTTSGHGKFGLFVGSVTRNDGRQLRAYLDSGSSVSGTLRHRAIPQKIFDAAVAFYSSKGPTYDWRAKPDVVAPGDSIPSAAAGSACSMEYRSGTSMATPAVAGAAALVRQFLRNSKALGSYGPSDPSGALIKAMLINSAHDMTSGFSNGFPIESASSYPACEQGFGRINLLNSLPVHSPNESVLVYDRELIQDENQEVKKCFKVHQDGIPLRVTLAYHDHPADVASDSQLVNDLDLKVHGPEVSWPMAGNDRVNNVERMLLRSAPAGQFKLTVQGHRLTVDQPFAVVISGAVSAC